MSQPEVPHLPMPTWLDVLRAVLPVRGVLLVGAGMGNGPWVQWLKDRRVSPVHLVEGDPRQYQHLTNSLPRIDGWTSWRDVAAASTGPVTFYQASNPAESGLLQPEALHPFWPHLDTDHSAVADSAITLDGLDAVTHSTINWLILDCLPAADLLQGGSQLLAKVDVALVRVVLGQGDTLAAARHDAADNVLRAAGLTCCHLQAERNPALAHALYVRDTGHQARSAQEQLRQAHELLEQKNQTLEERSQALERTKAVLEQERLVAARYQEQAAELAVNHAQGLQQLQQANDLLEQKNQALEERSQELERAKVLLEQERQALLEKSKNIETLNAENVNRFSEIASEFKTQNVQIEKAVQNLRQKLDIGLQNTVKQIESYIGIESYLTYGNLALPMHGWPISADFALYLIELIETHHYDLIIEFGSGTSTVLMARVMAKMIKQRQPMKQLAGQEVIGYAEAPGVSRSVHPQNRSAPIESCPPIMSFDHNRKFYDQTLNRLRQEGLEYLVELSHSPLRDYVATSGDHFLYYACEEKFAALAKQLAGQHPRILVVVDGPPGATNPHARYPAMPIILQHLAEHRLDVLLDDYSRKEEKEIVDRWIELLNQRSLKYDKQNLAFEKGACLLSIR